MKKFKNHTLQQYLKVLSSKIPVPGGGSTAALTGALGAALISMVIQYSLKKNSPASIEDKFKLTLFKVQKIRNRLLELVDLDAQAYMKVVKSHRAKREIKLKALKEARKVPLEVCRLCYESIKLTPFLAKQGNRYLLSDVQVAVELLLASFNSAMINVKVNQ